MSDGKKSCLGFFFLFLSLALSVLAIFAGGLGQVITWLGGETYGLNFISGTLIGIGAFVLFFGLSLYFFLKTHDLSWLPAILSTLYAVLPDIFSGPQDDIVALLIGVVLSGLLSWRSSRRHHKAEKLLEE